MQKKENNYAFIDSQNLNLGIQGLGWKLHYKKFRIFLEEKYSVKKAYIFIGYILENQGLYNSLQSCGYVIIFKPVIKNRDGKVKGNVDAELVLQAMIDYDNYNKAVIITSDGDFYCLVNYLYGKSKLERVVSPNRERCSILLTRAAKEKIVFIEDLRKRLEYINEKAPQGDRTQRGAFSS